MATWVGEWRGGFHSTVARVFAASAIYSAVIGPEAFRWAQASGMIGLGDLAGDGTVNSKAYATSADGALVVGQSKVASGHHRAFIWNQLNGMRNLHDVLADDLGLDFTGWILGEARDISADGAVIAGFGTNPDGFNEALVATIPEPATLSLLALGGLLVAKRRRQQSDNRNLSRVAL